MSYEIYFTLTTDQSEEITEKAFEGIVDFQNIGEYDETPGEFAQGRAYNGYSDEFKQHSLKHPSVLFQLDCEDSEGSYWKDYFKSGKHQSCGGKVVYEPFDETKLA